MFFLFLPSFRRHLVTETATAYVPHPEVQRVVFGRDEDGVGCLPKGVQDFLKECNGEEI
jgi:hypothetical protein